LLVEVFGVVFSFALLHTFAAAKRPGHGGVGVAYFVAGVAAARLGCAGRGWSSVAFSAIIGRKMLRLVFVPYMGL
jgi:hypothetical protein